MPAQLRIHINPLTGCWEWIGSRNDDGYGIAWTDGRTQSAHRAIWSLFVGPIGEGMTLDHLCRFRCCVNPTHLEEVSSPENGARALDVRFPGTPHGRKGAPAETATLLEDAAAAFGRSARLPVRDLIEALPAAYVDWDPVQLANALRPYGVAPLQLWIDGKNRRGYTLESVQKARKRYRAEQRRRVSSIERDS